MSYNIIFCIETFNIGGGATIALMSLIKNNPDIKDYVIFCRNIIRNEKSLEGKIIVGKGNDIITFFQREKFDLIHWFKANGNCLFEDLIKEIIDLCYNKERITVCIYDESNVWCPIHISCSFS